VLAIVHLRLGDVATVLAEHNRDDAAAAVDAIHAPADGNRVRAAGPRAKQLFAPGSGYIMRPVGVFHQVGLPGFPQDACFFTRVAALNGKQRIAWATLGYESTGTGIQLRVEGKRPDLRDAASRHVELSKNGWTTHRGRGWPNAAHLCRPT
jgi:hypothetical protein